MFIEKSMTRKVISIGQEASIEEARAKMTEHKVRHLPVVDQDNTLQGIITDRDIRSALPSPFLTDQESALAKDRFSRLKVRDVMTANPTTISPENTLEDALLLIQRMRVGAFPVVNRQKKLVGILSIRDLMRAFVNVLGLEQPGTLLGILVEDKQGQMKRIVDAITEERIPFGSVLMARHWEKGKRAVFPYVLTNQVAHVKRKLESLGFKLLDPMEWTLDQKPEEDPPKTD